MPDNLPTPFAAQSPSQTSASAGLRSDAVLALSRLALDTTTAELFGALHAGGVRAILLKGPSFERWLYDAGEHRQYGDIDVLVAPNDLSAGRSVLAQLGFAAARPGLRPSEWPAYAEVWRRTRPWITYVDLHYTVAVLSATPGRVWQALSRDTEQLTIAGGFARLAAASGWRTKTALLRDRLLPSSTLMRTRFAPARRGRVGLALAYVQHAGVLTWQAPRGARAWSRARRAAAAPRTAGD